MRQTWWIQHRTLTRTIPTLVIAIAAMGCASRTLTRSPSLEGDWDAYLASGANTRPGFEGWRRMGFAHFTSSDSGVVGGIRRRTGEPLLEVTRLTTRGDSVTLGGGGPQSIVATWHGDTLVGVMLADGKPSGRRDE